MSRATSCAGSTGTSTAACTSSSSRWEPRTDASRSSCCSTRAARCASARRASCAPRSAWPRPWPPSRCCAATRRRCTRSATAAPARSCASTARAGSRSSCTSSSACRKPWAPAWRPRSPTTRALALPTDVAMLISDAHVPPDELERALRMLASCARTAGLIHVVAADEPETDLRGPVELRDAETGRVIETTLDDQSAAAVRRALRGIPRCRARAVPRARGSLPARAQRRGRARPAARPRRRGRRRDGLRRRAPRRCAPGAALVSG